MGTVTLKGQPVHTVAVGPRVGSDSPALQGIDADFKEHSLQEFKGKKKIICFVPSLDTPVCSTSAQKFNQRIKDQQNVAVIYCSMDLPFALQRVCMNDKAHYGRLVFLSLFRHRQAAEAFGAYLADGPIAGLCARAVFVLDEHNKVLYHQLVDEITEEPDYERALSYL